MKLLSLKKKINPRLILEKNSFKIDDFIDAPTKFTPGEWFYVRAQNHKSNEMVFLGNANPFTSKGLDLKIVGQVQLKLSNPNEHSQDIVWDYIHEKIVKAYKAKAQYRFFAEGGRLVHGNMDGLHGLVIDKYKNCILVQISSAGIEVYREKIKVELEKHFKMKIFFLDNSESRKKEGLPQKESEISIDNLEISENDFHYEIPFKKAQKTGYYYDHRINRKKMERVLKELDFSLSSGLDLFSYVGSWTLHALRAGVTDMSCVDQSDLGEIIKQNVKNNNLKAEIKFKQVDAFSFLDVCVKEKTNYNLVICDPPGFSKNESHKKEALVGYRKLYNKIFKILSKDSVLVAASCTQQVSLIELDELVNEIALESGRMINILEIGLQSPDHTFSKINGKSSYIKCLIYKVS